MRDKCRARNCRNDAKIAWTFRDGAKGYYCPGHSRLIGAEIHRHAEAMAQFKPSGMPELRE